MGLTRREFLELMGKGAVAIGLSSVAVWTSPVKKALAENVANGGNLPVIWLQGQSCAGCSVSTLNTVHPDIAEMLTETISLDFHPNVMAASGELALKALNDAVAKKNGEFVLVVEGAVPTNEKGLYSTMGENNGKPITAKDWVEQLGTNAKFVLNVGTCSSFGGIPAANPNPTGAQPVPKIIPQATMVNIAGCPPHPDWIVGTIVHALLFGMPELDEYKRPKLFYGKTVHEQCERRASFEAGEMAKDFGDDGCLFELGCKGPIANCDSPIRHWNNHVNWCVQSGSPCVGCCAPTFPDHEGDGIYAALPLSKTYGIPWTKKA
jgi:hydrogenase small subunit